MSFSHRRDSDRSTSWWRLCIPVNPKSWFPELLVPSEVLRRSSTDFSRIFDYIDILIFGLLIQRIATLVEESGSLNETTGTFLHQNYQGSIRRGDGGSHELSKRCLVDISTLTQHSSYGFLCTRENTPDYLKSKSCRHYLIYRGVSWVFSSAERDSRVQCIEASNSHRGYKFWLL